MFHRWVPRGGRVFGVLAALCLLALNAPVVRAENLVDIDLVSVRRRYNTDRPVDQTLQPFSVSGAGVLTIDYQTDPYQGHVMGGYAISAADGSSLDLGQTVSHRLTPDPWMEGSPAKQQDVILVPKALQPLEATLAAWHAGDSMQVLNQGTQLPAAQRLTVSFLSVDQYLAQPKEASPEVDVSGAWGNWGTVGGADLIFVPKGNGSYDLAGRYSGAAKVSGRTVVVDYAYPAAEGRTVKGLWIFEVDPANPDHMTGAWMEDGAAGASEKGRADPRSYDAAPFKGRVGQRFRFTCPADSATGKVWGTDLYTYDSTICTAAVHAGVIKAAEGGQVTIEMRAGADAYVGSARNGVTSSAFGAFDASYVFVGTDGGNTGSPPEDGGAGTTVLDPAKVTTMTLQAGRRRVVSGQTVTIPIWLLRAADVANMNIEMTYDDSVVQATGAFNKGNLLGTALFEVNPKEAGIVRVGFAGTQTLVGDGTVAHVVFTASGPAGSRSPLRLKVTTLTGADGQTPAIDIIDGAIDIVPPDGVIPGDSDGDGQFTARDAGEALKMSVKLIPENKVCDVDRDGQVTSTDARLILAKVTGKP